MILDSTMFREYDIRGLVNPTQLNDTTVKYIGLGAGTFLRLKDIRKVVVGHDSRSSSPQFHKIIVEALISCGLDVIDIGQVLVPMFYFAQYKYNCKGGIYISASHNPSDWNGFKIANGYSSTLLGSEIKDVYKIIEEEKFEEGTGTYKKEDVVPLYTENILNKNRPGKRLKIVIDAGNGTAGPLVPPIFEQAGFEVVRLYCDLDSSFPNHEPNPSVPENKAELAKTVLANKADIGLALDTDGDRLGIVSEKGEIIEADQFLILLSRQALLEKPGSKIVFDVKSSQALIDDIKNHGGTPIMWKTGHSYIKAKLKEEKAVLAGELSGHIFYAENYGFDDAVFAAYKLACFLSKQNKTFSEILADTPRYISTPTINVDCADKEKYDIARKLAEEFKKEYEVIDISGARVVFPDGWGLVRASSNLPVLVLRFEGKTKESVDRIMALFKDKMSRHPEIGQRWYHG